MRGAIAFALGLLAGLVLAALALLAALAPPLLGAVRSARPELEHVEAP